MKCPKCAHEDTKVLESRISQEGRSVRRRRNCSACKFRFTTYEKVEDLQMQVHKKDGSFEPFCRDKVAKAIQAACIKRPVSIGDIETVVAQIEKKLMDQSERVIPSREVGDMTMDCLKRIDQVAYVRFASIYKDFKDTEEFRAELEGLNN